MLLVPILGSLKVKSSSLNPFYSGLLDETKHMAVLKKYIVDKVSYKWKDIATELEFDFTKVETIEADYARNSDRLLTVFGLWLRKASGTGEKERTLQTLHEALDNCDCKPESEDLSQHFGISKSMLEKIFLLRINS